MDHEWGPRLHLFVTDGDAARLADQIDRRLSIELPATFHGVSTCFSEPNQEGTRVLVDAEDGAIRHGVKVIGIKEFFADRLRIDPFEEPRIAEWLTFSEQSLLEIVSASIYHDDLKLEELLDKFRYYPRDVWLYLLSAQWRRIDQMEHLMGRSGFVGDELGSMLIANQIVWDLMRLCFLMERRYAPYAKWLGSAFRELSCSEEMLPFLSSVLSANGWEERERHLSQAYEQVAYMHNELEITDMLDTRVRQFHSRPYIVIGAQRFADAIADQIVDQSVRALPPFLGSVDQISNSTDVLSYQSRREILRSLYE